jgi:hypothetical protein
MNLMAMFALPVRLPPALPPADATGGTSDEEAAKLATRRVPAPWRSTAAMRLVAQLTE